MARGCRLGDFFRLTCLSRNRECCVGWFTLLVVKVQRLFIDSLCRYSHFLWVGRVVAKEDRGDPSRRDELACSSSLDCWAHHILCRELSVLAMAGPGARSSTTHLGNQRELYWVRDFLLLREGTEEIPRTFSMRNPS